MFKYDLEQIKYTLGKFLFSLNLFEDHQITESVIFVGQMKCFVFTMLQSTRVLSFHYIYFPVFLYWKVMKIQQGKLCCVKHIYT